MTKLDLKIVENYPKPGVRFIDINPLLQNPKQFSSLIKKGCDTIKNALSTDVLAQSAIVAPEARGFLLGAPIAYTLGLPLILIRKEGKIPNRPLSFHITNEYTSYNMEVDSELLAKHSHYIYIDDILATGQTLAAVRKSLTNQKKEIVLALHLTAVDALQEAREKNEGLCGLPIKNLI